MTSLLWTKISNFTYTPFLSPFPDQSHQIIQLYVGIYRNLCCQGEENCEVSTLTCNYFFPLLTLLSVFCVKKMLRNAKWITNTRHFRFKIHPSYAFTQSIRGVFFSQLFFHTQSTRGIEQEQKSTRKLGV